VRGHFPPRDRQATAKRRFPLRQLWRLRRQSERRDALPAGPRDWRWRRLGVKSECTLFVSDIFRIVYGFRS
jgi:hypothetical protein